MRRPRVDSEVGRLRSVLLHRPGPELNRLTPRNNDQLLFDAVPWVHRAQDEHDAFAGVLRERGVEVLLLADLLAEALEDGSARAAGIRAAVDELRLGTELADALQVHLSGVGAAVLAGVLTAGMTFEELPAAGDPTLVERMHSPHDFAVDPLPNLLFTRDSSVWIGDRVTITSLAMPARQRETSLTDLIYAHHPRFAGTGRAYGAHSAPVEGGDVLLLGPGVVAVGVGERTTPAGAESLARSVLADGLAHTVLAVPIAQNRASMHLDTVCTMVETNARLADAGIEVLAISGSELGSGRGGPRCLSCPLHRDPLLGADPDG